MIAVSVMELREALCLPVRLPASTAAYADEPSDAEARRRRLGGLLLAAHLYGGAAGEPMPELCFTERGKPTPTFSQSFRNTV